MSGLASDHADEAPDPIDNVVPTRGYELAPLVGLGGSAGAISALQKFFGTVPADSGQAFVVIMHLAPEHVSTLAELLQRCTPMPVVQLAARTVVQPNHVYVIPPGKVIRADGDSLMLADAELSPRGRHVAVDLFFRTLADTHGPHAAAIVLSGADGDGAVGIKRIKERGGLTIAQDPQEAEHSGMPRTAIATGMVDWVLPVGEIQPRLAQYFALEKRLKLPAEEGETLPARPGDPDEAALRDVLALLRSRTGRDFSNYKRATVVRRIARRMQVNGVVDLPAYLDCLRTRPGEAVALLQDLLISVTNFFRDVDCFAALDEQLAALFKGKGPNDTIRVWVAACATGEEAYSIAILLAERARELQAPPMIQVFATDLDDQAIKSAREGSYPATIEADVSEERLRRYFFKEHHGYKVRREMREMVLFAQHDLLRDSPFSRLDLISCRNLLIYLNRDAQKRLFETFHFALLPQGMLFLGSSESAEDAASLFGVVDKKHRIYAQRPSPRAALPVPTGPGTLALALEAQQAAAGSPVIARRAIASPDATGTLPSRPASGSLGELHFKLLEAVAPPSILVDSQYEILHISATAGRFLQYAGGEPSRNLLHAVLPDLRIELRAALFKVAQTGQRCEVLVSPVELEGASREVEIRVDPAPAVGADLFLVMLSARPPGTTAAGAAAERIGADPLASQLDREIERLKLQLRDTVEQYEASTEELKASNEELQAMNEELRSATEELETSREELQSINEELTTVNQELKGKVDQLAQANSDMRNLMHATEIATVFLDRDLCITLYTPAAVSLFNLIATDLGRPLADLATRLEYPEFGADAKQVLEHLVPIEREVRLPAGKWFLARLLPYRTVDDRIGGVVISFIDITQQKHAAEALRASDEQLRLVVENATEYAIFSTDMERRITVWNTGAQRLLGYVESEVVGRPADIIFTEEDRAAGAPQTEVATAVAQGRASDDRMHQRKDGSRFWASGVLMLMKDGRGKAVGFVKILRDQTAERENQQALERSQIQLMRALEENEASRTELQAADAAKDRFLAVLSHELRNPLASIDSAAGLLQTQKLPAADRDAAAQVVQRQAQTMKKLLDDLLDVSRLKLGRLELQREDVMIARVVESALETTRPLLEAARHAIEVNLPPYPVKVHGDPLRLGQVVSNLLTNAIKYTPPGGRIVLSAALRDRQATITVTDNGVGIEPARIEAMFDMFTQGQPVIDRTQGGLGIGLALVRSIVELHGGTVEASSAGPGKGSEFRVTLPAERGVEPAATPAPTPMTATPRPASRKRGLILIADDNLDAGWGITRLLEISGFATCRVRSGVEAVKEARRQKPDVAILDIGMPDLNGHEVARQIRESEWGKHMVLIAATGWGQQADERAALAAGFDAHMTKPVDLGQLDALVEELLARKRG